MGAIFEKGLMIGFGFILLTILISMINPILSVLITDDQEECFNGLNKLALTFDYSLNYYQNSENETKTYSINLSTSVKIDYHRKEEKTEIFFKSSIKNLSIITNKIIQINVLEIYGIILIDFNYYPRYTHIEIEMV